jgi:alpha-glucosidase (family GH31 glycosyl hydrolase)
VRWLQYGVFQPVFRPHAQEEVAPEPVFRDEAAKKLAAEAIRLRYAMLPYNYTTAFDNSRTGMPLMRPMLFEEPENGDAAAMSSTYLWGHDFLVAPVVEPGVTRKEVYFPNKGSVWFDFYSDKPHRGGITEALQVVKEHIPVFVRAGAFIPLAKVVQSTRDYSTRHIELHYYHDASVSAASGKLYDDDGETAQAWEQGKYELAHFTSAVAKGELTLKLRSESGKAWKAQPRSYALQVHNVAARPKRVMLDQRAVQSRWDAKRKVLTVDLPVQAGGERTVSITL